MRRATAAGNRENRLQTMVCTEATLVMETTESPVTGLVSEMKPERPSSSVTRKPEIADPNFCAIVPEEKMSPVEEVPFFSVA